MKALQTNLQYVPGTVFLGDDRKSILFSRYGTNNFIDYQQGQDMVAWTKDFLCVGNTEYKYNTWHQIDEPLKGYFREVLRDSIQDI